MEITVFGKNFSVTDAKTCWKIKRNSDRLTVALDISKDLCETADDLRAYMAAHPELFGGERKDGGTKTNTAVPV